MRIRWKGLELPTRVVLDTAGATPTYGMFIAEPFERGFGVTVGNSLRRILLSSLEGAAVMGIKLESVLHEFSSVEGVREDVTDIVLNVKGLVVRLEGSEARTIVLEAHEPGPVTAGMIQADPNVEIINKDHKICTLSKKMDFRMELRVAKGRGYITAEENTPEGDQDIGYIPVDSLFSPVERVRYRTEDTRVGHRTNYDRLLLEIWTNGTLTPEMALVEAGKILRKHLNPFVQYFHPGEEVGAEAAAAAEEAAPEEYVSELERKLAMPIAQLELSVRAANCLESENIMTVGQLVRMSEEDLLAVRSFGKTSLREVKRKLADLGLSLGMDLEGVTAGGGGGGGGST
ncbi:MAG: DNA-directed RNA polymerase subunit alpha [Planctomycetota bacterium]|nr:DNA-directed RNA polymerase subunit alpha [Planctomycetota bacterium]